MLLLAALLTTSRGDFTIVQKVESGTNEGSMTLKLKGDLARADLAPQVSVITNVVTGDVVTLQHAAKVFIKVPAEQARAVLEHARRQQQAAHAEPPKLTPTGRQEKIERHDCEVFTWEAGEIHATDWIARDFPNFPTILAALEKFQNAGLAGAARPLQPSVNEFPGMLIRRELVFGGQKNVTTLVSVTEAPIDDAVFNIPESYREQTAPAFDFGHPEPAK
jgi:Domain of unknown function (DUF4412)